MIYFEEVLSYTTTMLGVSNAKVSRLLNVSNSSISFNMDKTLIETHRKKTGRRLIALFFIVNHYFSRSIDRRAILDILTTECKTQSGLSVLSLIQKDVVDLSILSPLAELVYQQIVSQLKEETEPLIRYLDDLISLNKKEKRPYITTADRCPTCSSRMIINKTGKECEGLHCDYIEYQGQG